MQTTGDFKYKILFSRRRTLSIIISPDQGVIVKAPNKTPAGTIRRFISAKSGWIIRTLDSFKTLRRMDSRDGYYDGDSIMILGTEHRLKLIPAEGYSIRLGIDNTIEAQFKGDKNPLLIKAILEGWFKFTAQKRLANRFRDILVKYNDYGFSPTGFVVRKMKKRWGSCSSKGKIAISYDLIRLDDIYAEYVIIHELCHLKHHNHSADYYRLLSEVYPDWKRVREELKKYIR